MARCTSLASTAGRPNRPATGHRRPAPRQHWTPSSGTTPYTWAQSLAADLGAPLLTYTGEGHTAYGRSNQCVTDVVDAYLVDGVVPEDGVQC